MTMTSQATTETDLIRPIIFLTLENERVPAPLLRITTCGLLTIEVVEAVISTEPPLARYHSMTPEQLRGRGTIPALTLLKFLLSRSERFASRDWLMDQFCRDRGEAFSNVRLDNIASQLRSLLCLSDYESLRTHIVALLRTGSGSGDGYQLAPYPLIWVDHEALARHVEQAARMERFGDDPLAYWERAYELAKRGPYCPDEMYSDWAVGRRGEIAGMLRQSVQALARIYVARHGQSGEEEALLLLRSYWQEHPREEDVLRPLMELLGRRENFQEALEYYERLTTLLKEEERAPDPRTADIAEYVRTKQLQRSSQATVSSIEAPLHQIMSVNTLPTDELAEAPVPSLPFVHTSSVQLETNHMAAFEENRRMLLKQIMGLAALALPLSSLAGKIEEYITSHERHLDSQTCFALQQLIETCWQLCNAGHMSLAEQTLSSFLPSLIDQASFQPEAARLASQGLRLKSILRAHRLEVSHMIPLCQQSVAYAQIAGDPNVLSAAMNGLAVAFKYNHQSTQAFEAYKAALLVSKQATPLLRSRVYAGAAAIFASRGQEQEAFRLINQAYEQFPTHPENDPFFFSADNGLFMLAYYEGLLHLALKQPKDAFQALERSQNYSDTPPIPERNRLEILNHQGQVAILTGDLDKYAYCLDEGVKGALRIQSRKRLDEALTIFREQMPRTWLAESTIEHVLQTLPSPVLKE